jgi:cytochrome P450
MTTSHQSLGSVYDPLGAHLHDPYGFYQRARREAPVFFSAELNAWVVTRYDDVREVLRQPELFSSANAIPMVIPPSPAAIAELERGYPPAPVPTNADGAAHVRLRAAFAPVFTPERIAAIEPFIRQRAEALVDAFAGDGHAEFMTQYAEPLPVEVITRFCGLAPQDAAPVRVGAAGIVALVASPLPEPEQAGAARKYVALQQLIGAAIRERRAALRGDLISELITALAPGEGPLGFEQEAELVNNVAEVLVPGQITTIPLLGNGLRALLEDRSQWELLCARPELIPGAVEEIARLGTPMAGQGRVATREVTLGGVRLEAGAALLLMLDAANRDEARFERAEQADVARPPTRHLTFGFGAHYCLGAGLARKEIEVTLQTLTQRLPGLRLVEPQTVEIAPIYQLRGPAALQVTW